MYKSVLEIFEEIAQIPHKSFHTDEMFEYICRFAKQYAYKIKTDNAKNIYAFGSKLPRLCFQSHYDMVGVGEADFPLKLCIENGFLKAQNSSLGADNGIGVASQLYLMQKYQDLEFLFTNNEEVGLLGAKGLELKITSNYLINLDSEVFGEIVLGCAGGYDMNVSFELPQDNTYYKYCYKITSKGFKGGHSGVDIHKSIKNAIVSLVEFISGIECAICSFMGGEKSNSLPVFAQVIIKTNEVLQSHENFSVEILEHIGIVYQKNILEDFIFGVKNGVRVIEENNVLDSLNVSLVKQNTNKIDISLMGRANTKELLEKNLYEVKNLALKIDSNVKIQIEDFYLPWCRNIEEEDEFLNAIKKAFQKEPIKIGQIHAGLECGILQERFEAMGKNDVRMLSIGPTILSPHSVNERLDMVAFEKFCEVLENLAENYKI
ncbi:M20/M25/M40 family metallo-hydrolase [Helicobacter sp. 13S00477-4]|uniref:M20/M25/M40 family metallo-hydrolase n=1 Tax=Helicobacter sp. 13S00477-4 TaxID=1905759 RepID=UPI000BA6D575|nr:M20/M25/M40 family metallo-hydrolase [Helicobacter sp. 13S00477-4]PAF50559.1 hypothetical protein BKH44_07655 [Helicobacter sp. 13S00477-4]